MQVDLALLGAGGAGLSLVLALDRAFAGRPGDAPRVALVDPVTRAANDRTWCWWTGPADPLDPMLHRAWRRMELVGAGGSSASYPLGSDRYVMLRSADFYRAAEQAVDRIGAVRIAAPAGRLQEAADWVHLEAGEASLSARWVFDSRPAAPRRPGGTFLLQHFRGWTVRFPEPVLDPGLATLMDFRLRQPGVGVGFVYCLPLSDRRALLEYTEFSPDRLRPDEYDRALRRYLGLRWPGHEIVVEEVEEGAIPMTDAPFPRRTGPRTFRLGTAGGATRASTGYTFAAMQRQADGVVRALQEGRTPVPPRAYPPRHRWLDAVLLRALQDGALVGPELFTGLFARNPPERVFRFLDGASGLREELAVMRSVPAPPMVRAGARDLAGRVTRRLARSVATTYRQ